MDISTSEDTLVPHRDDRLSAYSRDLATRFSGYPDPSVLDHHSLSRLAADSLLRSHRLPREVSGGDEFKVVLSHCFSHGGVDFLAYEDMAGGRLAVFGTVYHVFLGIWHASGRFEWRYPREDVLGYSVDTASLSETLHGIHARSRMTRRIAVLARRMQRPETVLLFGHVPNIGHHVWNEQSGLEFMVSSGLLAHVDAVWIGPSDYFDMEEWFELQSCRTRRESALFTSRLGFTSRHVLVRSTELVLPDATRQRLLSWMRRSTPDELTQPEHPHAHWPVVGLQLRQHSRKWLGETDGMIRLIAALRELHPDAAFVIDGFGRPTRSSTAEEALIAGDRQAVTRIRDATPQHVPIASTVGLPMSEKLALLASADVVISPIGSGGVLAHWLLQKSLVCYGPPAYYEWTAQDTKAVVESPGAALRFVAQEEIRMAPNGTDYDLDWAAILPVVESILDKTHES